VWNFVSNIKEHRLSVFENRAQRRIFGPKRDEVTGGWRTLRHEEFYNLYSSQNIIWMIRAGNMRWAGHVARMGEIRNGKNLKETEHLEELDVDGRIIVKWIFGENRVRGCGMDSSGSR
jgi:hypothetical protein